MGYRKIMAEKKDRIGAYLEELNHEMLFDELSEDFMKEAGIYDLLAGVPVPIAVDDEGLSNISIALGMARIIGADNNFRYADKYMEYIKRTLGDVAVKVLISEAAKCANEKEYEIACMYLRTALFIDPKSVDALYLYARACQDAYQQEEDDENYIGSFKAESLELFELLTMLHPNFPMGYYFLGYAYLNLGLYTKAKLTWDQFMEMTQDMKKAIGFDTSLEEDALADFRLDIAIRLDNLIAPIEIESGINAVLTGDYIKGRDILEKHGAGKYAEWWPLWYYLAGAYSGLGDGQRAIDCFKTALRLSPSNLEVMGELLEVYKALGDAENIQKYERKIEIIKQNLEDEKKQMQEESQTQKDVE